MIYNKGNALSSLKPNAQWAWNGDEYSGLTWLDSGTAPTESEIDAEVTRLNNAEPMRLLRVERDKRLTDCDWVSAKATDTGVAVSDAWKIYRQALRDLPSITTPELDGPFVKNVTWPTKPS